MFENQKPLIVGNWKMNGDRPFWQELAQGVAKGCQNVGGVQVVLCPPSAGLADVATVLAQEESAVLLGAQNMHSAEKGAFTGEVSASMLQSFGCSYVILGHSERREFLTETNAFVAEKTKAATKAGLCPIVCIGEPDNTPDPHTFLTTQLQASLQGVALKKIGQMVLAYEPIWAIGTGKTATPEMIKKTMGHLRQELVKLFGEEVGGGIQILYGGSMTADNAKEICAINNVAGGLVGGASLKASNFIGVVENAC